MNAQAEVYFNPIVGFPDYKLKKGDRITVTKGDGHIDKTPDYIEVIEELPNMILCNYCYKHWMGHVMSYRRCLNKESIAVGDIVFRKEKR